MKTFPGTQPLLKIKQQQQLHRIPHSKLTVGRTAIDLAPLASLPVGRLFVNSGWSRFCA